MVPFLPLHRNRDHFISSRELGYEYSNLLDASESGSPTAMLFYFQHGANLVKFCFITRSEAGGIYASLSGGAAGPLALAAAHRGLRGDRVCGHGRCSPDGEKTTPPAACGHRENCPPWKAPTSLGQRWRQRELSNSHLKVLHCDKMEH